MKTTIKKKVSRIANTVKKYKRIIPSIIATNQEEFYNRYRKIKFAPLIHLDVMDGNFVKNKSLNFYLELPKHSYETHLLVKKPEKYIPIIHKQSKTIIFHFESCKNSSQVFSIINKIKKYKTKVGIAINPKTKISQIQPFLKSINLITIMAVNPGKYGAKFLPLVLKKSKEIKKINPKLKIEIDGGINNLTIKKAKIHADQFISGSFIQKSKNPKQTYLKLKQVANK